MTFLDTFRTARLCAKRSDIHRGEITLEARYAGVHIHATGEIRCEVNHPRHQAGNGRIARIAPPIAGGVQRAGGLRGEFSERITVVQNGVVKGHEGRALRGCIRVGIQRINIRGARGRIADDAIGNGQLRKFAGNHAKAPVVAGDKRIKTVTGNGASRDGRHRMSAADKDTTIRVGGDRAVLDGDVLTHAGSGGEVGQVYASAVRRNFTRPNDGDIGKGARHFSRWTRSARKDINARLNIVVRISRMITRKAGQA